MAKFLAEFAPLPVAAALDARLTSRDLRVLVAVCAHDWKRSGDPVSIVRKNIAALARVNEAQVSRSTARLADFGWLLKVGNGGRSRPADYTISWSHVPETVSELIRVLDQETRINLSRVSALETRTSLSTVSPPDTETVLNSDTVSPETRINLSRVSPETLPNSDTVSTVNGAQFEEGQLINSETDNKNDQSIDSRAGRDALEGLSQVYAWMEAAGMPPAGDIPNPERSLITGWLGRYTLPVIQAAIERSAKFRANKAEPLMPKYVNRVLLNGSAKPEGRKRKATRNDEDLHAKDYGAGIG